jgi:cytochrome b561
MRQPLDSPEGRYGALAQAFHWLTAVLVLAAFITGPGGPEQRVYLAARDAARQTHETLGMAVFLLTALRLAWRAAHPAPALPPMARWMGTAARVLHGLLYVLLVAVPVTAILGAWLEGHPLLLHLFGTVPSPWAESRGLGTALSELHPWLGDAIVWLAGAHALAALYHHFVLRDSVLRSMLPGGR